MKTSAVRAVEPSPREELLLDVDTIDESPTNPRKTFVAIGELAADIARRGVKQAVLVRTSRTTAGRYELIVGARRLRATKKAGLSKIPAVLDEMDDLGVIETQIVENDQRVDVPALERASGYAQLEGLGFSADEIAKKVSKSKSTILASLKLLDAGPELRTLIEEGGVEASTALPIARLPEELQRTFLTWFSEHNGFGIDARDKDALALVLGRVGSRGIEEEVGIFKRHLENETARKAAAELRRAERKKPKPTAQAPARPKPNAPEERWKRFLDEGKEAGRRLLSKTFGRLKPREIPLDLFELAWGPGWQDNVLDYALEDVGPRNYEKLGVSLLGRKAWKRLWEATLVDPKTGKAPEPKPAKKRGRK